MEGTDEIDMIFGTKMTEKAYIISDKETKRRGKELTHLMIKKGCI